MPLATNPFSTAFPSRTCSDRRVPFTLPSRFLKVRLDSPNSPSSAYMGTCCGVRVHAARYGGRSPVGCRGIYGTYLRRLVANLCCADRLPTPSMLRQASSQPNPFDLEVFPPGHAVTTSNSGIPRTDSLLRDEELSRNLSAPLPINNGLKRYNARPSPVTLQALFVRPGSAHFFHKSI